MTKSNIDIEDELYRIIRDSPLAEAISGDIYQGPDERPDGSKLEDIEIIVIADQNADIQQATISINIYVSDVTDNGKMRRNKPRLRELSRLGLDLFDGQLPINIDGYRITLESQGTYPEHKVQQHYYNLKLNYSYHKTE